MAIEIVDLPTKHSDFQQLCKRLPEGKICVHCPNYCIQLHLGKGSCEICHVELMGCSLAVNIHQRKGTNRHSLKSICGLRPSHRTRHTAPSMARFRAQSQLLWQNHVPWALHWSTGRCGRNRNPSPAGPSRHAKWSQRMDHLWCEAVVRGEWSCDHRWRRQATWDQECWKELPMSLDDRGLDFQGKLYALKKQENKEIIADGYNACLNFQ